MISLGPLISAFIIGFLILSCILKNSAVPHRILLTLILAAPVGLGVCSLALFWAYCAAAAQAKWLSIIFVYLIGISALLYLLSSGIKTAAKQKPRQTKFPITRLLLTAASFILFCFMAYRFIRFFASISCWDTYGGWDARFIWNLKAKFFFRSPAEWAGMFRNELYFSHPDYPLLIPGAVAWGWNWVGKEILIWPMMVAFVFAASLVLFIFWHLLAYTNPWNALLACSYFLAMGAYLFWSYTQYADIPLCFYFTASVAVLLSAVRLCEISLFFLSGLLAGLAAWTKNEGLLFLVWMILILSLVLLGKSTTRQDKKNAAIAFAAGTGIPLLNVLCLKIFFSNAGDYLGSGRTLPEYISLIFGDPGKTRVIWEAFQTHMARLNDWAGLWVLFFCAVLIGVAIRRKKILENRGWVLALAALCIESGYFVVIHTSPGEVHWQIETALTRLLLHAGALAVLFSFEVFSSFWPETAPRP